MKTTKKIAIATAAALAMFGISAVANAAPLTVTVNTVANATTSAAPVTVSVPATNVIDAGHSVAIAATADTGTAVTFSGSGVSLVTALNAVGAPVGVASGLASFTTISAGAPITVYAFTTSTNVGTVTITNGGYSTVVFVKGNAGPANAISILTPKNVGVGTIPTVGVSAVDAFGNPVAGENISVTLIGTTFSDTTVLKTVTTASTTSLPGVLPVTTLGVGTATLATSVAGDVTIVATDVAITPVAGLTAPIKVVTSTYTVNDFATLNATLKSKVEDLTAQLDAANKALAAEKAAHAADLASAVTAKATSDKALADANTASIAEYNKLVAKYNALAASYSAKAKKYKFSSNVTAVPAK